MLESRAMRNKLNSLATIQMGHAFRTGVESKEPGNVAVIQLRDLGEGGHVRRRPLALVEPGKVHNRHWVRHKDLVFRSRGKTTTAQMIHAQPGQAAVAAPTLQVQPGRTVVAAPLLHIRVTSQRLLPEYLCWLINQPPSQAFLHSRATGTAMVLIGKSALDDLEVPLPALATQKRIAAVAALSYQEQQLMNALAAKKRHWLEGVLMRLAQAPETNGPQQEHSR